MQTSDLRLAVLIDADNVPRKYLKLIMEEIAVYGNPTLKRIYGDWTLPSLSNWKDDLLESALTPIQQYSYTTGKNSTDSAMIIDAMDILYSGNVDGFCIVSSDSDFTRLVIRLREAGKKVIGLGERKTPNPFIAACDRFVYIEVLANKHPTSAPPIAPIPAQIPMKPRKKTEKPPTLSDFEPISTPASSKQKTPLPQYIVNFISQTIDDVGDDEGWAYLGEVGSLLQKKRPDFDSRNYGYKKLSSMLLECGEFEIDNRGNSSNGKLIYIRVAK